MSKCAGTSSLHVLSAFCQATVRVSLIKGCTAGRSIRRQPVAMVVGFRLRQEPMQASGRRLPSQTLHG